MYKSMSEVNPAIKGIKPPVTLTQANEIADMADAIAKSKNPPDSPWAVAIANFKKTHVAGEKGWTKKAKEMAETETMKTVNGEKFPASDFLVVEDAKKPSTWHLQVKRHGKPDHGLMGGAWGALHKGHRGKKYEGPQKEQAIAKLKALYKSEEMALPSESARFVGGQWFELGDFLVFGEKDDPESYHLPVRRAGDPDHELMEKAWAALTTGHKGRIYDGPLADLARKRLARLFESENLKVTGLPLRETPASMETEAARIRRAFDIQFGVQPDPNVAYMVHDGDLEASEVFKDHPKFGNAVVARERNRIADRFWLVPYTVEGDEYQFTPRTDWRRVELTWEFVESQEQTESVAELQEVELCESFAGHAVSLSESDTDLPLRMQVALIRAGWGNKKDMNFYPAETLRNSGPVFVDAKMFESDHNPDRTNRDWVSVVDKVIGLNEQRELVAEVVVHSGDFAERAKALHKAGKLHLLECSILARGTGRGGTVNGTKGHIIEAITEARAVDWVTKAGAGGHAMSLRE